MRLGDLSAGARQAVPQQPCSGAWPAGGQLQREPPACSGVKEPRPSPGGQEAARATQDGQKHGLQRRGDRGACGGTQRCLRATREAELPTAEFCGGGTRLPGDKCQALKQTRLCISKDREQPSPCATTTEPTGHGDRSPSPEPVLHSRRGRRNEEPENRN